MSENQEVKKLSDRVDHLSVDLNKVSTLFERLDETIDKLSSVSNDINNLVSAQTARLAYQEKNSEITNTNIETNRKEVLRTLERIQEKQESITRENLAAATRDLKELRVELKEEMKKYVKIDEFAPIQRAIYAVISLILTAVIGAVLSMLFR